MTIPNAPYRISGPHRRPAGKMAIHPQDSRDALKLARKWAAQQVAA